MKVIVRAASASDLGTLVRLNRVVQRLHADLEATVFKAITDDAEISSFFAARLEAPENYVNLADCDGRSSGYIWFEKQDKPETFLTLPITQIYVHHLAVDGAVQRNGIASALLGQAEAVARASGSQQIILGTWAANKGAQAFFKSRGFSPSRLVLAKRIA